MKAPLRITLIALAVFAAAAVAYVVFRHYRTAELYQRGYSVSPDPEAVEMLAEYNGGGSTKQLLDIFSNPSANVENRHAALRALLRRSDRWLAGELTRLLQLHEPIGVRLLVAEALPSLYCDEICVLFSLKYLERRWRGERDIEDIFAKLSTGTPLAGLGFSQTPSGMETVERNLKRVLLKEKVQTLAALERYYGLGSLNPSPFSLYIVKSLELKQACASFEHSLELLSPAGEADTIRSALTQSPCRQSE